MPFRSQVARMSHLEHPSESVKDSGGRRGQELLDRWVDRQAPVERTSGSIQAILSHMLLRLRSLALSVRSPVWLYPYRQEASDRSRTFPTPTRPSPPSRLQASHHRLPRSHPPNHQSLRTSSRCKKRSHRPMVRCPAVSSRAIQAYRWGTRNPNLSSRFRRLLH